MTARLVDLRSDTVSLPNAKMRLAMQSAEVGDSQKAEDPSVNRLEALAAQMLGKEAAIFLPSGTMSNLIAIMAHCRRGDRAVVGQLSHILNSESDGITLVAGVMPQAVPDFDGIPSPADVERALTPSAGGSPYTSLICLENTHNWASGAACTPGEIAAVAEVGRRYGIPIHMDGARLFNAVVALKVEPSELVKDVDSVCFCLSKGLGAPFGSVLCGSNELIERAWRIRRILGGAMRQAGHMAAAGIVALEEMVERLEEDHAHARYLAELLAGLPVVKIDPARVETNMIVFEVDEERMSRTQLVSALAEGGVKVSTAGKTRMRMITHLGISREDVEYAASVVRKVVTEG